MAARPVLSARIALRAASAFPISKRLVRSCVKPSKPTDALFERARVHGLNSIERSQRSGHLARVIGEVAESISEIVLDEQGYNLFWQITTPGIHGVDLLFLSPDECVLALEVKGTLRPGTIPRFTASRLRQMSREWLNDPANPAMAEWSLQADDLYAGVMLVDLTTPLYRLALSGNFEHYTPVTDLRQVAPLRPTLG
ncbi:MAG TPA: hypothetical protein VFA43_11320 [Gemmatimonadaceae bacterium]|nr:hypothetical protein [Gemmatimonadaceae bacterium]